LRIRLIESVSVIPLNGELLLTRGKVALRYRTAGDWQSVSVLLKAGTTRSELERFLTEPVVQRLLRTTNGEGWLTTSLAVAASPALERQIGYLTMFNKDAGLAQTRVSSSSVSILGVGGIGVVVAEHLARAGVGSLSLIDFDFVEESNLNRHLLFDTSDVGKSKVEAARDHLRLISPKSQVNTHHRFVESLEDLVGTGLESDDVLVIAIDQPRNIATELSDSTERYGVRVMMGAVGLETGFWGPFLVPGGHQLKCLDLDAGQEAREWADAVSPTPWSFGPSNTVIGAQIAHDVIQYVASNWCLSLERRNFIDFSTLEITSLQFVNCSAHRSDSPRAL